MYKNHQFFLGQYYRLADLLALNLAFLALYIINEFQLIDFRLSDFVVLPFLNLLWLFLASSQRIYNLNFFSSRNRYYFAVFITVLIQFGILLAFNDMIFKAVTPLNILLLNAIFLAFILGCRACVLNLYKSAIKKKSKKSAIVVVGSENQINETVDYLRNNFSTSFLKIFKVTKNSNLIERLETFSQRYNLSELFVPISFYSEDTVEKLSTYCDENFIRLRLIFDWNKLGSRKIHVKQLSENTVLYIASTPLDDAYNSLLKRSFDFIFSLLAFVFIFSWLFPIIAIAVKLSSKGPVFFKQQRSGLNGNYFYCYKFRSMKQNAEADLKQATKNDDRITKVGHFLRKTSLDELPQFINVLKGEMSIVGPRPHMLKHTKQYSELVGNFMQRHAIKPGITGLAQVKGYRGEIDDYSLLQNRVRFDRFYVNNWTLFFDVKIIIKTVLTIFKDHR